MVIGASVLSSGVFLPIKLYELQCRFQFMTYAYQNRLNSSLDDSEVTDPCSDIEELLPLRRVQLGPYF